MQIINRYALIILGISFFSSVLMHGVTFINVTQSPIYFSVFYKKGNSVIPQIKPIYNAPANGDYFVHNKFDIKSPNLKMSTFKWPPQQCVEFTRDELIGLGVGVAVGTAVIGAGIGALAAGEAGAGAAAVGAGATEAGVFAGEGAAAAGAAAAGIVPVTTAEGVTTFSAVVGPEVVGGFATEAGAGAAVTAMAAGEGPAAAAAAGAAADATAAAAAEMGGTTAAEAGLTVELVEAHQPLMAQGIVQVGAGQSIVYPTVAQAQAAATQVTLATAHGITDSATLTAIANQAALTAAAGSSAAVAGSTSATAAAPATVSGITAAHGAAAGSGLGAVGGVFAGKGLCKAEHYPRTVLFSFNKADIEQKKYDKKKLLQGDTSESGLYLGDNVDAGEIHFLFYNLHGFDPRYAAYGIAEGHGAIKAGKINSQTYDNRQPIADVLRHYLRFVEYIGRLR